MPKPLGDPSTSPSGFPTFPVLRHALLPAGGDASPSLEPCAPPASSALTDGARARRSASATGEDGKARTQSPCARSRSCCHSFAGSRVSTCDTWPGTTSQSPRPTSASSCPGPQPA